MSIDVSIIIPTFRRPTQLVEAIHSALGQAVVSVEVIVLDDSPEGSARPTVAQINHPCVTYFHRTNPSGGRPALVRNEGYQHSRGRYIHFLDDDDRIAPGALQALVDALDNNNQAGMAFGWVVPFGDDPVVLENKTEWFSRAADIARSAMTRYQIVSTILFKGALLVNSACMIRRRYFEALGGYDPTIVYYQDVDFWMRCIRRYGYVFVDQPILQYRTGADSRIHNLQENWKPVEDSYAVIHRKYRAHHGLFEYAALQFYSRFLPAVSPPGR